MNYNLQLNSIAQGDQEQFEKLYYCLNKPIYLLAYSIIGDSSLAEDIMHETFIKIRENASSFRRGHNAKAWIMTITRNLALNCLKKRGRETFCMDELTETSCAEYDVDQSIDFKKALSILNEAERSIVILKIQCGFRHSQIAKIVGISSADSRARYSRALKKLKTYYEQDSKL